MRVSTLCLRLAGGLPVLAVAGGCVSATFVPTGGAYPPRPPDCEIQVFSSAVPDRDYEEMGIVEGEGSWWKSNLEDVLPKLKEEACLAGGDALILGSNDTFTEGDDGIRVQRITATVIHWTRNQEAERSPTRSSPAVDRPDGAAEAPAGRARPA